MTRAQKLETDTRTEIEALQKQHAQHLATKEQQLTMLKLELNGKTTEVQNYQSQARLTGQVRVGVGSVC